MTLPWCITLDTGLLVCLENQVELLWLVCFCCLAQLPIELKAEWNGIFVWETVSVIEMSLKVVIVSPAVVTAMALSGKWLLKRGKERNGPLLLYVSSILSEGMKQTQ